MSCSPCSPPLCREIYGQAVADLTAFTSKGLGLVCVGLGKTGQVFPNETWVSSPDQEHQCVTYLLFCLCLFLVLSTS